jgi:two-component system, sensor histidine kinase and response regulator
VSMQRILVVDDSPTQAERLRLLLTGEGYDVDKAPTGADGLRTATDSLPDLIISDVTMPGMDGFDFCRAIKTAPQTRDVPFILLTSRYTPVDIITGLECGADNFIPKTYEDAYLLERIRRVFEELEHRKDRHRLDMEVVLTVGGRKINVTADRQQIIELLFATFEEVSRQHDELAQANRELRGARIRADQASRAKTEFIARISHEIRTPLHAIMGYTDLLDTAKLDAEDHKYVETIRSASNHLLDVINDLIDIGRIEEGQLDLTLEAVRLEDLFQEAAELLQPLAGTREVTVRLAVAGCDLYVLADRQRLKQVLINLVSNGVKYNSEGGTLILGCEPGVSGQVRILVTDTGPGIAPEHLDRLFTPFDRGAATSSRVEGTGLGLALCQRLVTAMDGILGVESEVGTGTTFWIQLDRATRPPGMGAAPT